MKEKNYEQMFIDKINSEILSRVDFDKLDSSCNSSDNGYAVEVLKNLHQAFVDVYGTDSPESDCGFVTIPAVLRGRVSGRMAVGLVSLDLESSGEHYGSCFFTKHGVIDDHPEADKSKQAKAHLKQHFTPYDYWYTPYIQRDHHVDFDRVPERTADILDRVHDQPQPGMQMK